MSPDYMQGMQIRIYNESAGAGLGGSDYCASVLASALSTDHVVEFVHHHQQLSPEILQCSFGEDLSKVNVRYEPPNSRWLEADWKRSLSNGTDCLVSICHWAPPECHAKQGILYILFPHFEPAKEWPWTAKNGVRNYLRKKKYSYDWSRRMRSYQAIVSISEYTRHWTQHRWRTDSQVIFPPVDLNFPALVRENRIIAVGRFCEMKRQLEMTEALRAVASAIEFKDWRMDCCGNPADETYFQELCTAARDLPIDFVRGADRTEIKQRMSSAKIFWHAAGYGIDEKVSPGKLEHFGIVTVEAMAAGCVPVVVGKGGQAELVEHGVTGFHWQTLDELRDYTLRLVKDGELLHCMSQAARARAQSFAKEQFISQFRLLIDA